MILPLSPMNSDLALVHHSINAAWKLFVDLSPWDIGILLKICNARHML